MLMYISYVEDSGLGYSGRISLFFAGWFGSDPGTWCLWGVCFPNCTCCSKKCILCWGRACTYFPPLHNNQNFERHVLRSLMFTIKVNEFTTFYPKWKMSILSYWANESNRIKQRNFIKINSDQIILDHVVQTNMLNKLETKISWT